MPQKQTPAAMLRYYRLRKGLTTRQLAESVGIVPATLLLYERKQMPIPYKATTVLASILEIDSHLLFDKYCEFLDYPYQVKLKNIRQKYGMNQQDFASKADIVFIIYSRWECGSRSPSRKMYQELLSAYPEIE